MVFTKFVGPNVSVLLHKDVVHATGDLALLHVCQTDHRSLHFLLP